MFAMIKFLLLPVLLFATPREELFQIFAIPPTEMVESTQRLWMQQGKERWQFEERYEHLRPQLWPLFKEMGMVDEIKPTKAHYDTVIILGALRNRVQDRVAYLIQTGVTYDRLVFLAGQRPLLPSENLPDLQTEAEMSRWVYDHSPLSKDLPLLIIDAPMKGEKRPSTVDTIKIWLQTNPCPLSCLAISSQPYIHYQEAVLNRYIPFEIDVAGPSVLGDPSVDLMLDTIAREITYKYGDDACLPQ